ncbi:MAG: hypothetical protein ACFFDI_08480 [Promethearchaeota archaeon]
MAEIVFSIFDEKKGPIPIFTTIKDFNLAKKIAVKSMVSTLTNVQRFPSHMLQGEAILPFPNENKIAFIFFSVLDRKIEVWENSIISLSVVVDNDKKSGLYASAIALSQAAVEIKDQLNEEYKYGQTLPDKMVEKLLEWSKIVEEKGKAIIPKEKRPSFSLHDLFELFPVIKSFRSYKDPLVPLFLGLMFKIPIILVGSDKAFLLEITDLFRKFVPHHELDVRPVALPVDKSKVKTYKIPRADLILLNEKQYKHFSYHSDPIVIGEMGGKMSYINYSIPDQAKKIIENILRNARDFDNKIASENYLEKEMFSFFMKLSKLKEYCSAKKKLASIKDYVAGDLGSLRDAARFFDVDVDYIITLAESIRVRMDAPARTINKMFQNETKFTEINTRNEDYIGFITN